MNRKAENDAEFCGKVPLHQTNLVQPHGILMVVGKKNLEILQASENIERVLGLPAREAVGTSLADYIPQKQAEAVQRKFEGDIKDRLPFLFSFSSGDRLAVVQARESYFIVELESEKRAAAHADTFLDIYQDLRYIMAAIESAGAVNEVADTAIRELKRISGFDKIMVYRFDAQWNGDVVAEVMEPGMDSYLGLKFPASDIPKQARELYRTTPYRLIPNIHYDPVKLYPVINPLTNAFTDLSDSNLRSVAGVHLEYLKNMGVVASMSCRILMNGQLWGLIACHHRTPLYLSFERCAAFELLSQVLSSRITLLQNSALFAFRNQKGGLYSRLVEDVYSSGSLLGSLQRNEAPLLEYLSAEGVAIVSQQQVESYGTVPGNTEIEDLVYWLQSNNQGRLYHQPSLPSVYEPAANYAEIASGILALPIQPERGTFILAFRPEAVRKVSWGGNPNEAVRFEPDGKKYHPRHSFEQWQQTVRQTSIPWKPEELEVAEQFRNFVVDYTLNRGLN